MIHKEHPARYPNAFFQRYGALLAGAILVLLILSVYWPVRHFEFTNFDDSTYVTENSHVKAGLTLSGLKWALKTNEAGNWHPLTWFSHMLDWQLYGANAGGHHITNLIFHLANTLLLFALLVRMTRQRAASFVVAALFALHPLHVESVAWVAERKDVLSTFFGFLVLLAYVAYVEQSKIKNRKSKIFYGLSLFCFALSLLSKPMLVTLPFLMLLLDFWPLGRTGSNPDAHAQNSWRALLLEKIPFLTLVVISCATTMWAQKTYGAVVSMDALPLKGRVVNAVVAYYRYLGKIFWPTNLAAFYPYNQMHPSWAMLLGIIPLLVISITAVRLKKFPCIVVGWFWFVGMLVPVIGLVQVGGQSMADRYTYVPAIGIFIAVVFGLAPWAADFRFAKAILATCAVLSIAGCLLVTQRQALYWHDSIALFRHAIAVTKNNQAAYDNLGVALQKQGNLEEAAENFKMAVRAYPGYSEGHCNLGSIYVWLKRNDDALQEFQTAVLLDPKNARAHYFLAGRLLANGDVNGALEHYRTGLALRPDHADFHYQLAIIFQLRGEIEEAHQQFRQALRISPDWIEALNNLAWSLATQPDVRNRNGKEALELAAHAVKLTHTSEAGALDTLAAAFAENSRFPEAIETEKKALALAPKNAPKQFTDDFQQHLKSFEQNHPWRESSPTNVAEIPTNVP